MLDDKESSFILGTKAETLEALRPLLRHGEICASLVFSVGDWRKDRASCLEQIQTSFPRTEVIVRSSSTSEDTAETAMAGVHDSILEVPTDDNGELISAIDIVSASYIRSQAEDVLHEQQILVQPMVEDVSMSGVVFTRDIDSGGPYYVINYDDVSGKTDTVTSGIDDASRTLLVHRDHVDSLFSERFKALIQAISEIESLVPGLGLDVEFAVSPEMTVYIFQVRRLATQSSWDEEIMSRVNDATEEAECLLRQKVAPDPDILGDSSLFGIMPDWNPAEMIGTVPRRLAASLYEYLITDSIWAEARANMGYRDLSGRALMIDFAGHPFIDARESFNSYLPADLDDSIGAPLVDHWLEKLRLHHELHDKVEFDVAYTIATFDSHKRMTAELSGTVLSPTEVDRFHGSLVMLTNRIVGSSPRMIDEQRDLIGELIRKHDEVMSCCGDTGADDARNVLLSVQNLLKDCRTLGTRPFSIVARCGFIAEDFLRSMVRIGALSEADVSAFRRSFCTVASDLIAMLEDMQAGQTSQASFLKNFGHLRPGTYDILSPRYDQCSHALALSEKRMSSGRKIAHFALTSSQKQVIAQEIKESGFTFDVDCLMQFIRDAIVGREYAKQKFSRNISNALELIAEWGKKMGLTRDDVSHLAVDDILNCLEMDETAARATLGQKISEGRERYEVAQALHLPFLIGGVEDLYVIPLLKCRPNFVTKKQVCASGVVLTGMDVNPDMLDGRIVLIEGADPGYDWVFTHPIAGIITKFGGANSHMAIRCAELEVPAGIGCGEQLFESLCHAPMISLDCGAEQLLVST